MSYRDLQAQAKKLNVPANLKKAVLIEKIQAATANTTQKENAAPVEKVEVDSAPVKKAPKAVKSKTKKSRALKPKASNVASNSMGFTKAEDAEIKDKIMQMMSDIKTRTENAEINFKDWDVDALTQTSKPDTEPASEKKADEKPKNKFADDEEINEKPERMPMPKRTITDSRSRATGFLPAGSVQANMVPDASKYKRF